MQEEDEKHMKNSRDTAVIKSPVGTLFLFTMAAVIATSTVSAQTTAADRIFESEEDGFWLQIPQGWVRA